jgi:branched-subunit amino acid ABC-type transport system permease component
MQFALTALSNAAVLIPLVIGLSLVFRISGVIVFAAGQIAVFAGMLYAVFDAPLYVRIPVVLIVGVAAGMATYVAIIPAQRLKISADAISLATLGVAFVLEYIATHYLGRGVFSAEPWVSSTVDLFGTKVSLHRIVVMVAALALAAIVILLIDRTLVGRAMEATAYDPTLSQMYGLRVQRFRLLAWAIAGACIASVGIFQVTIASVSQSSPISLLTLALASAVVGGLGGLYSGLAGALLVAVVQAAVAQFISSELQVALAFALLFLVLLARPGGLFSSAREARRV